MRKREVVVIGASTGGVQALRELVGRLPPDLPAAILVVVHTAPDNPGYLAKILDEAGALTASMAWDREPILPGRILVAPPDRHLIVQDHRVLLDRGPRVNNFRPAVDPLFLSAASAYGEGVIGVILSGGLDDGSFGLAEIKRAGGPAVVQDPEEAFTRGMPDSAIRAVEVDHVLPSAGIADLIVRLAGKAIERRAGGMSNDSSPRRGPRSRGRKEGMVGPGAGPPSMFVCPDCGGALWEARKGRSSASSATSDTRTTARRSSTGRAGRWRPPSGPPSGRWRRAPSFPGGSPRAPGLPDSRRSRPASRRRRTRPKAGPRRSGRS